MWNCQAELRLRLHSSSASIPGNRKNSETTESGAIYWVWVCEILLRNITNNTMSHMGTVVKCRRGFE